MNDQSPDNISRVEVVRLTEAAAHQFAILAPTFAPCSFGIVERFANETVLIRPISVGDGGQRRWLTEETFHVFAKEVGPLSVNEGTSKNTLREIDAQARNIVNRVNGLLAKFGLGVGDVVVPAVPEVGTNAITVGCSWCPYSHTFHVWLPKAALDPILLIKGVFEAAQYAEVSSASCEAIGAPDFVQIDARAE